MGHAVHRVFFFVPMRRFHAPDVQPGPHSLGPDEARHLAQVLRARPSDMVELADGRGAVFPAEVLSIGKREVLLQVGVYAGVPRANKAFAMAKEIFAEMDAAAGD